MRTRRQGLPFPNPDESEPARDFCVLEGGVRLGSWLHRRGPFLDPPYPPFVIVRGDGDGEWKPGNPQLFITPGSPFLGGERRASGNSGR